MRIFRKWNTNVPYHQILFAKPFHQTGRFNLLGNVHECGHWCRQVVLNLSGWLWFLHRSPIKSLYKPRTRSRSSTILKGWGLGASSTDWWALPFIQYGGQKVAEKNTIYAVWKSAKTLKRKNDVRPARIRYPLDSDHLTTHRIRISVRSIYCSETSEHL